MAGLGGCFYLVPPTSVRVTHLPSPDADGGFHARGLVVTVSEGHSGAISDKLWLEGTLTERTSPPTRHAVWFLPGGGLRVSFLGWITKGAAKALFWKSQTPYYRVQFHFSLREGWEEGYES